MCMLIKCNLFTVCDPLQVRLRAKDNLKTF